MKYQHKPNVVEAAYWDGNYTTYETIAAWAGEEFVILNTVSNHITIKPTGLIVTYGQWIIKNETGELYPADASSFAANYDRIEE